MAQKFSLIGRYKLAAAEVFGKRVFLSIVSFFFLFCILI